MNAGDQDFFLEEELQAAGGTPRHDPRVVRASPRDVWQDLNPDTTAWTDGRCNSCLRSCRTDRATPVLLAYIVANKKQKLLLYDKVDNR